MRVGCGISDNVHDDEDRLRRAKCDCLIIVPQQDTIPAAAAMRALRLLNEGDSLVVTHLHRFGDTASVINIVDELRRTGAKLDVLDEEFCPDRTGQEQFMQGCSLLKTLLALPATDPNATTVRRRRGRPTAVKPHDLAKAYDYLTAGVSVKEAARRLKISRSTLYRILSKVST